MLMAFADDALPPETAAVLASRIAADPRLAAKVARFKADRALLRAAFDPVLEEPVPERLVAAIRARATAGEPGPASHAERARLRAIAGGAGDRPAAPAPFLQSARRALRRALPAALAASLALVLGFTLGRLAPGSGGEAPAGASTLAALLESEPVRTLVERGASGESAALAGGATAVLLGTLELGPGRYCRELELVGGPQPGLAIVCRSGAGTWPVAALVALAPAEAPSGFAPAGAEPVHDPALALREALGTVRLLEPAAEAALRARGWR
ncbi:MAG: hypothetical protein NZ555_06870 [Geminicoccaceae bacterium]|nr:hypothetical protein [Geminicoccaceae bacterium]MCX8100952.1 hypothetical protein [Geminicoccaceae bacterium]